LISPPHGPWSMAIDLFVCRRVRLVLLTLLKGGRTIINHKPGSREWSAPLERSNLNVSA